MPTFFETTSYNLANGKWIPRYNKIIKSGSKVSMQEVSFDKQLDSKKEADEYAENYCLQRGYFKEN